MTKPPAKKPAASPAKRKRATSKPGVAPGRRGAKGVMGQPRFVPTKEQRDAVTALVSIGTTGKTIAKVLHIPERTLYRHFVHELAEGKAIVHAAIGGSIVAGAMRGDKTLMIFYAKAQMGWRESVRHGFEDEKGAPVNPQNLFSVRITG